MRCEQIVRGEEQCPEEATHCFRPPGDTKYHAVCPLHERMVLHVFHAVGYHPVISPVSVREEEIAKQMLVQIVGCKMRNHASDAFPLSKCEYGTMGCDGHEREKRP